MSDKRSLAEEMVVCQRLATSYLRGDATSLESGDRAYLRELILACRRLNPARQGLNSTGGSEARNHSLRNGCMLLGRVARDAIRVFRALVGSESNGAVDAASNVWRAIMRAFHAESNVTAKAAGRRHHRLILRAAHLLNDVLSGAAIVIPIDTAYMLYQLRVGVRRCGGTGEDAEGVDDERDDDDRDEEEDDDDEDSTASISSDGAEEPVGTAFSAAGSTSGAGAGAPACARASSSRADAAAAAPGSSKATSAAAPACAARALELQDKRQLEQVQSAPVGVTSHFKVMAVSGKIDKVSACDAGAVLQGAAQDIKKRRHAVAAEQRKHRQRGTYTIDVSRGECVSGCCLPSQSNEHLLVVH